MKLKLITATALLAVIAAFSIGAQAASDTDKAAKAPVASGQADKKTKPDTSTEAKTAVPQETPAAKSNKLKADQDKGKHYHPRDGKS